MTSTERYELIIARLTSAFHPEKLILTDDSQQHAGHRGASSGAGHYTLEIASQSFHQQSKITCHRMIYQALGDLIPDEIHAISIKIGAL